MLMLLASPYLAVQFWQEFFVWISNAPAMKRVTMNDVHAFIVAVGLFFVIYCLEHYYGVSTGHYRSRGFLQDVFFWHWTRSGLNRLLLTSSMLGFLNVHLSPYHLNLLEGIPAVPLYILYFVLVDFLVYWIHRWRHRSRFMWAFHTTHHAQEQLSFLTVLRIHPVEFVFNDLIMLGPLVILGPSPESWLPLYYFRVIIEDIQHSHLP